MLTEPIKCRVCGAVSVNGGWIACYDCYATGATRAAEKMIQALTEIKDTCGKVCEEFELCTHESCRSSVRAWMIAEKALRDCGGMLKEE